MTSVPLIGEHDGARDVSYFYAFDAGPGDILVTFDAQASKYSTNARLKVADANRNPMGELYLVAATSPSSMTKKFHLDKHQRVVLETMLQQDTSMGVLKYSVNVSGPVQLARPVATASGSNPERQPAGSDGAKLRIELRDGTTRDFDMARVRRIVVE